MKLWERSLGLVRKLFRMRLELAVVLILGVLALAPNIAAPPLIDWDEATYAQVTHEAVASGRYLDLTWNGKPYLKKPPLLFWMMAASYKALGEGELAARLPSVLMGLGTLALLYLGAAAVGGRIAGVCAALIPLGFYYFVARAGRECATDAPLLFFTTLALNALTRVPRNRRWLVPAGVACGLAILSKGVAGLIPVMVAIAAVLIVPGLAAVGWSGLFVVLSGAVIVAAPWYVYQAVFNSPIFFSSFVEHETLLRVTNHLEDNSNPANFTLLTLYSEVRYLWPLLLPLAVLVIAGVRNGLRRAVLALDPSVYLWLLWFAIAFGSACAVQTKLGWYVVPALIPIALLGGTTMGLALKKSEPFGRAAAVLGVVAIGLIAAEAPARWRTINQTANQQRERSLPAYMLAMRAQEAASGRGGELFFAGIELPTLVYYSGMRCHFVETSELKNVELVGMESVPRHVRFLDLVLLDSNGSATAVGNLGTECSRLAAGNAEEELIEADDFDATEGAD